MSTDKGIDSPWEQQEICKLLKTESRSRVVRVEQTSPLSKEGKRAVL